jgi:HD-like signal output (HDOD) protein
MEELASSAEIDPGMAYTIGLLRSIGKVVLDGVGGHSVALAMQPLPAAAWEEAQWGVTSAEVTARVFEAWGFPRAAVRAVREHVRPGPGATDGARLLHVAAALADANGCGFAGEDGCWTTDVADALGLSEERIAEAAHAAMEMLGAGARLAEA